MKQLIQLISELKAPKGQYNSFGKYKYRSCEDILEAVKPLLAKYELLLSITDDIILIGDRYYIKATAMITDSEGFQVSTSSLAREEDAKKGMDASQITGSASSYARKYALSGLFYLDDTKDADATNKHGQDEPQRDYFSEAFSELSQCAKAAETISICKKWEPYLGERTDEFKKKCRTRYEELSK